MPATKTIKKPAAKRSKVKTTLPSLSKLNALKQELSTVKSIEEAYSDDLFEVECEIVEQPMEETKTIEPLMEERNEIPRKLSPERTVAFNPRSEEKTIEQIPKKTNESAPKIPKINIEALVKKVIEEEMSKKDQLKEEKRKQKIEEQLKAKAKEREELQSYLKNQIGSIQNRYKQELTKNLQFSY